MNKKPKIVFSRSLENVTWKNTTLKGDIVPEEINKMEQQPGKDILVVSSASIVQTLVSLSQDGNPTEEAREHSEKKLDNDAYKFEKVIGEIIL